MSDIIIDKLSGDDKEAIVGQVKIAIGDEVKKGDLLFSLESSKGVVKVLAKVSGKIRTLDISDGDTVSKSQKVGSIDTTDMTHSEPFVAVNKKTYSFGISTPQKETIHCEVLVIGGGPGGYVAAIRASQLGKQTVLIEKDALGGTCLNYGCIPTKALAHSVEVLEAMKQAEQLGFKAENISVDFQQTMNNKNEVIHTLVMGIDGLMAKNQIKVIEGTAVVLDAKSIGIKSKKIDATITFDKLIIAVGSSACKLPIEGSDLPEVLTSTEVLELTDLPKSLTVIGGGVIGMEIAFIYNALGSAVSVVEFLPNILNMLDHDVINVIRKSAIEKGIKIYENTKARKITKSLDNTLVTEIEVDNQIQLLCSEKVLMAVGRRANLDSLDLEKLEVKLNERANGIKVNHQMQTSNPNIYAIGDITNIIQLAHVASHQGMVCAEHIAGRNSTMHYDLVPSTIFTMPEVGTVGLSEAMAIIEGKNIKVVKFPFMACGKAVAMHATKGFVKLIIDADEEVLLGGTIVGAHGTDMIATITELIKNKISLSNALETIYAHPTLGETIHEALLMADGRGINFG
jgi:dihydrolipoamide dehydrogenase